jgi:hypothetical protein
LFWPNEKPPNDGFLFITKARAKNGLSPTTFPNNSIGLRAREVLESDRCDLIQYFGTRRKAFGRASNASHTFMLAAEAATSIKQVLAVDQVSRATPFA